MADVTKKTNVSRPRQLSAEEPDGLEELVFFGFFCDVGHFCPSGIGFFGWFGDVGHGKPSLRRPTTRILFCVFPPMPPEGFLFVEPHQGIEGGSPQRRVFGTPCPQKLLFRLNETNVFFESTRFASTELSFLKPSEMRVSSRRNDSCFERTRFVSTETAFLKYGESRRWLLGTTRY